MLYIGGEFSYMNFSNPYNNIVAYEYQTGLMAPLASIGLNGKVLKIVAHNASSKKTFSIEFFFLTVS